MPFIRYQRRSADYANKDQYENAYRTYTQKAMFKEDDVLVLEKGDGIQVGYPVTVTVCERNTVGFIITMEISGEVFSELESTGLMGSAA